MPRLITGGEDGATFIWSGKTGTPEHRLEGKNYHQGPVTCLAVHHSEPLLLTGIREILLLGC
jgi:WD40 repeat protein